VSTPQAFRDWDRLLAAEADPDLHNPPIPATIEKLSRTYASVYGGLIQANADTRTESQSGASGILPDPALGQAPDNPEKPQGLSREQHHDSLFPSRNPDESGIENDLAENSLLALVRTGIENDFETVVFPQYPLLREIKRQLMGTSAEAECAVIAALSGSGSALFGLYRTPADAAAAQHRLQQQGVEAIVTKTMPRTQYWNKMFAE
jgi:4-diphosphocytidyl-2-C-methyl-D-erythritol kinase